MNDSLFDGTPCNITFKIEADWNELIEQNLANYSEPDFDEDDYMDDRRYGQIEDSEIRNLFDRE